MLLEQLLALELKKCDDSFSIYPVFVGELENHPHLGGEIYSDFFKMNGIPKGLEIVVEAVESKLLRHLQRLGKGAPRLLGFERTVKSMAPRHQFAVLCDPVLHRAVLLSAE